jgi:hypothetical protein
MVPASNFGCLTEWKLMSMTVRISREKRLILPEEIKNNQAHISKVGSHEISFPILIEGLGFSRHDECKRSKNYCTQNCSAVLSASISG